MAKLSSVSKIEVGGVTYERTDEDVRAGDIVQCFEDEYYSDLTLGAFYKVIDLDHDDEFVIIDDEGDRVGRYQFDSDFVHFRKVGGEDSGIIEHDGVRYRKVRRRAEAGEKVVITGTNGHFIRKGEVVTAIDSHRLEAKREQFTDGRVRGSRQYVDPYQYFVLEPIAPAFNVGDYVRVITDDENLPEGTIGKITVIDETGGYNIRVETIDGFDYDWFYAHQLENVDEQTAKWAAIGRKVGEFKVGDVVEVIDGFGSCRKDGDIRKITNIDDGMFHVGEKIKGVGAWLHSEDIKLIAPVESVVNLAGASE